MEISCAFPTALDSPQHIALAEQLGYRRAWLYDTPQQSPDVWMTLALAAERTERPVEVPIIVAALGPKGRAVTRELADGLFVTSWYQPSGPDIRRELEVFMTTAKAAAAP